MSIFSESFKASAVTKTKQAIGAAVAFGAVAGLGGYVAAPASADMTDNMKQTANTYAANRGFEGAGSYELNGAVNQHGDSVDAVYAVPHSSSSPEISVACDPSSCSINWVKPPSFG